MNARATARDVTRIDVVLHFEDHAPTLIRRHAQRLVRARQRVLGELDVDHRPPDAEDGSERRS